MLFVLKVIFKLCTYKQLEFYWHLVNCRRKEPNMSGNKVTFGVTSKGNPMVIHKQYEFVKHRKYASGNIQWRCKLYQNIQWRCE